MYLIAILPILGIILQNVGGTIVWVEQGALRGEKLWTVTKDHMYYSYKGIPYAAPPVGDLRFKVAQPAPCWDGIRNATEHGNVCPQFDGLLGKYVLGSGLEEDCLYLNVYKPCTNTDTPLPVMVFIHGGGFEFGSGNVDNYGPDFFMNLHNVILVTFNYRLDTVGFLCLDSEELPGNLGLKDQVAALKWVNRNIDSFGGDPNKVTIFGQSAGGLSCNLHAISPMSRGLFQRIITMSGVPLSEFAVAFEPKRRGLLFGKNLGFETTDTKALYNFLKDKPVKELLHSKSSIIAAEEYVDFVLKVYFPPVVEKDFGQERFLLEPPLDSIKNGRINDVDILMGYNIEEAISFISTYETLTIKNFDRYREVIVPRNVFYHNPPETNLIQADIIKEYYFECLPISLKSMRQFVTYITDLFIYDVIRYARHLANCNEIKNMFLYQFSCISERNILAQQGAKYNITGVGHVDDLNYIFNSNALNIPVNKSAPSYKMIRQTTTLFTNFAIYGTPTPNWSLGVKWPRYNTKTNMYLDIGEKLIVKNNPKNCMMDFWESIFWEVGLQF